MEKSKKSLPGGAGQRDLSKNAIKKGHGLKTVVSDFLPEVRSESVRFTLAQRITEIFFVPVLRFCPLGFLRATQFRF